MYKEDKQGWVCPKCGRVYAPWQSQCLYCNDLRVVYAQNTTIPKETKVLNKCIFNGLEAEESQWRM